ncbi:MAG: SIS domain-containing protein, partial [Spirochaetes bacterium]|nr:SIS domain-containing protein [Spirochaetota bacterium]
ARIPATVEDAAELRYKNPIVEKDTLYFAVSQSGETLDTIAAMREIQMKGGIVLGLTNVAGSTIARETNGGVFIHAGPEIAVASTKTFTAHITVMLLIALLLGRTRDISLQEGKQIIDQLVSIPDKIQEIFKLESFIKKTAQKYKNNKCFLFLSRGINYPVALEGALKLKEITYLFAEGFTAANLKHGPIALINEDVLSVIVAVKGATYEKTIGNIEEIKARKGKIIIITNAANDPQLTRIADELIVLPDCAEYISPLLTIIPLQLLAYYLADALGRDIDKPRNLAKTVTVE